MLFRSFALPAGSRGICVEVLPPDPANPVNVGQPNVGNAGPLHPMIRSPGGPSLPSDLFVTLSRTAYQSDAEHELVRRIHQARDEGVDFILFNPAAFTHTSIALRDALLGVAIPFIEIHLSNVAAREAFRQQSFFADIAVGTIAGFGANSYELALEAAARHLS